MSEENVQESKKGLFRKFTQRLRSTRQSLFGKAVGLLRSRRKVDEALLEELEEILITADVGVETTLNLVGAIREAARAVQREG